VILITVNVNAGATILINNATVDYAVNPAGNIWNHSYAIAITLVEGPLLLCTKTAPATANTGEVIVYQIRIENIGNANATNINITEFYPAGLTFLLANPVPDFSNNIWDSTAPFTGLPAVLQPGDIIFINIWMQVNLTASGLLVNLASIDYTNETGYSWPTEWVTAETLIIDPLLVIRKSAPITANTGEVITYTLSITNIGSDTAYNVVVTETYPVGVTFMSAVPPPDVPTNNVWSLGDLSVGTTVIITIDVQVTALTGTLMNMANASYQNSARDMPVVWAYANTTIYNPVITIAKSAPAQANSGEIITYWITYSNTGDDWAYNVVITETYPFGVAFLSATPTPDISNNVWLIGTLASGSGGAIQVTVQIEDWATGWLFNNVTVDYENAIGADFSDSAMAATEIIDPLMIITKTAPATATTGEAITYTITYQNVGTDTAYNVVITETYPPGVNFVSSVPMPDSGINVWNIGTVPVGLGGTITITVDVVQTTGVLDNYVELTYYNSVREMTPVSATARTMIIYPVIDITKTAPATANTGEIFDYVITVENVGTANATNVIVTETYPAGINYVGAVPAPTSGNNVWNLGTLAVGASVTITITVQVTATSGWLDNLVEADYENTEGITYPTVQATARTLIINPDMIITKWAPPVANTGEVITYWINFTNIGTDWAYDVIITETYPPEVTYITAFPLPTIPNNIWYIGDLAPGASDSIVISVQVNVNVSGAIINYVELAYNNSLDVPMPPVNATAITWVGDPMMEITKIAPPTAVPGQTIQYIIQYWNNGSADAFNVWINDTLPAGVTFDDSNPLPTVQIPPLYGWYFAVVPSNSTGYIFINVTIDANASGFLLNQVIMKYEDAAGQIQPVESADAVTIITGPYIRIIKIAPQNANPGDTIMYIIQYSNLGQDDAHNVWINDTLPAEVTFVDSNPVPTDQIPPLYAWFFAVVPAGTTGNIYINVTIDANATGAILNWVFVTYENAAGQQYQGQANATTFLIEPFLRISKQGPAYASPGETISYWVNYTNAGNDWAYDVVITETYPIGVIYVNASPMPDSGNNVWHVGDLAPGASGGIQIWVTIDFNATSPLINFVEAAYNNSFGVPMPPVNATLVTLIANPLLEITKWAPPQANPGEFIMYLISYTNVGQEWAYNVVIEEFYPPEVTFQTATPFPNVGNNIWFIGDLAPGAGGSIEIWVTIALNATGIITNLVEATYQNAIGIDMEPVQATADTLIVRPLIEVSKSAPATAGTGEIITYTIMITNSGTSDAVGVVLSESYPSGVTYQFAMPAPTIGDSVWYVGTLTPGSVWSVTITVQVNLNAFGSLINNVYVNYSDGNERQYPTAHAQAITVVTDPYLVVDKDAPAYANPGQIITYTITITNLGTADALNVELTETYPAGIIYLTATPLPTGPNNYWYIGTIAPGASVVIQITVQVDMNATGTLRNWVAVDYENSARTMPTVRDYADTTIIAPEMVITKWAPAYANSGEIITYWINYSNIGNDWAYNVIITENYPVGIIFMNATPYPDVGDNIWFIGDVAPNATGSIMIIVQVNESAVGILTNWVYLDYSSSAMPMPQESAFADTEVIDPVLVISKVAPATATPNEVITYQLIIENIGNAPAYNVYVYEDYPPEVTFISANPAPWLPPSVWHFALINVGGIEVINISVRINAVTPVNTTIVNHAYVNYTDETGAHQPEDHAWANTTIIGPQLVITKWATPFANEGDTIYYWVNYSNVGNDWAYNVVITETYPPGVTFLWATPPADVGIDTWIIPLMAPGTSGSIQIALQVNIGITGVLTNHVDLDFQNRAGHQYPTIWAEAITVIGPNPNVIISKQAPATANSGQVIMYTITYQNIGNSTATNVWINDTLPNGVQFLNSNPAPSWINPTPPPEIIGFFIGPLAAGAGGVIFINVTVTGQVYGIVTDVVYVDCANATGVAQQRRFATATTRIVDPLMEIHKSAPPWANDGDTIMYTLTYFNAGNDTAYNVWVNDTLPSGAVFVDSNPLPTVAAFPVYSWFIGAVPPQTGGVIFINVTLNYPGGGTAINNVTVNYTNAINVWQTPVTDSNQTQVFIGPEGFIVVTKWANRTVNPGGVIMYIINYTNIGNGPANNVWIYDIIPPNTVYLDSNPTPPDLIAPPQYGWNIGVVPAGAGGTIFMNVTVGPLANGTLVNWVWANWTTGSTNTSASTIVVNPDMYITKTAPAYCQAVDVIQYRIDYFNVGTDTAYNVNITENYPPGVTFFTSTPMPTFSDNVWIIAQVPAGGSGNITITVNVASFVGAVLNNTVWLNYSNAANVTMPPESAYAITEVTDVVMTLTKTALPLNANPGDIVTYTITFQNLGPGVATNVMIQEFYPVGMNYQSSIPPPTIGNNIWLWPPMAPLETGLITIFMMVDANATGILENRAQLNYTDTFGNPFFLNATAITIVNEPYMTLDKTAPFSASPGQTIQYVITFENIGSGYAANVTITENYPAGVMFSSANPAPNSGNNVWNIGVMAPGELRTIIINVIILTTAFDTLTNWVYLTYQNLSGGQQPTLSDYAITVIGGPGMVITKSGPLYANTGQLITYTIDYANAGLGVARNVLIEDVIPAGVNYISSNPPGVPVGGRIMWALGNVPGLATGTITITFQVTALAGSVIDNWVFLNYTDLSGNQMPTVSDNQLTIVSAPDVQITKWAPATANSGEIITYWINYTNVDSPWTDWAYNVRIVDIYDPNTVFISSVPPPDVSNNEWLLGPLAPGASGSIMITVQILDTPIVNNGDIINNTANMSFENQIGTSTNISAFALTLIEDPILTVEKFAPAFANTGQYINYMIYINNTGDAPAYNVIVTESYPPDVIFISASPMPTISDNIWIIPFLADGATFIINITVMVNTNVPQLTNLVNLVTVDYEDAIGITQIQVQDTAITQVIDPVIVITKSAPPSANTGNTIMYTITYFNTGNDTAYNVWVNDTLPSDVVFVDSSIPPTVGGPPTWSWLIGMVPAGTGGTIYINVTILNTARTYVINWVFANYTDSVGEVQPEESATATTIVTDPFVTVNKTTTNVTVCAGQFILYNITYRNWGTGNATNVTITETYPTGVTFMFASPPADVGNNVWIIPNLPPGAMGWIEILVQVNANVTIGDQLNNTVNLTFTDIFDRQYPGRSDYATSTVIGPIMVLRKFGPAVVNISEIFNYTVIYENVGNDWAYNLIIRDIYPVGVTVLAVNPPASYSPLPGVDQWNVSALAPGANVTIRIMVQVNAGAPTWLNNSVDLSYRNAASLPMPTLTVWVLTQTLGIIDNPPEIYTTPPPFVWADQIVTIWAEVIDRETGVDTVIIYYTDIHGVQHWAVMIPNPGNYNTTTMNGWYNWTIPAQDFKGIITYYVWANDTNGNANRTGLFDVPVRLPPFYVWGRIRTVEDLSVGGAIVLVTNNDTNETVIAVADGTGNYIVDFATLYSGYMNGERIQVFATDGLYYGYNYSAVDLDSYSDPTMSWPNTRVDVVLSEIPEFTMILTPIVTLMLLAVILRRITKKRQAQWEDE
jgi:uncharacterized repeat protein (TIGR01451 family)